MENPLVSICCITYNHGKYIRDCIEGFLMQQTSFKFEILIHDDASSDDTIKVIKAYEEENPSLIKSIIQSENRYSKGQRGFNFKYNFPRAKGKYIAMCEGDDYWTDPLKLQKQVDFMEQNSGYSLICHNALIIYEENASNNRPFNTKEIDTDISMSTIVNSWVIPTASMFFRKEHVSKLPSWVYEIYSGDFTMALLLRHRGKIFYMNDIMSVYRISYSGDSASATVGKNASFIFEQHIKLLSFFNDETNGVYLPIIEKRIRYLKKEIRFGKLRSKGMIQAIIYMPRLFLKKAFCFVFR